MQDKITVIGAGLAGVEAANQITKFGMNVELYEMKPIKKSPAHKSNDFAELVCSNSLKASRADSAAGLLKEEMRKFGSICLESADNSSVAAGGALAVEREKFSSFITEKIKKNPLITVHNEVIEKIPEGVCIIATGPLTDQKLADNIRELTGSEHLSFYDAAAPIVTADSIDFDKAFFASRYGKGSGDDYINCPMEKDEYDTFYNALITAESAITHEFDVYEGCMPIEVLAKRGNDSIRFGPLKPVGLRNPKTDKRPWAVVQLRRENTSGTMYNLVGFQTNLKFLEQKRVFSLIPGLENSEFVRYGVMHRNTFIDSPRLLNKNLSLKKDNRIFFAGQLSGVEGYMESAASGIVAGINAVNFLKGNDKLILPDFTMIGALLNYITDESVTDFQPMGANFGIIPPLQTKIKVKKERYAALSQRALEWYQNNI